MPKVIQDYREMAKEKIIESASKLFFQMGYNNAGMENIARDMGITKGTLYLYFKKIGFREYDYRHRKIFCR